MFGFSVNAIGSTPYATSVGGTDFGDTYAGTINSYWNATNNSVYGTAGGTYVPEIPWDDSCTSPLIASYLGIPIYGSTSVCNTIKDGNFPVTGYGGAIYTAGNSQSILAGSGGPSSCATGQAVPVGGTVVNGTCAGWPKPSWQSVLGNPSDGVRDQPDVAMFSGGGTWTHFYMYCNSDSEGCYGTGGTLNPPTLWGGVLGTSLGTPIWAGIQALINQKIGTTQSGLANPILYQLARAEYGSGGNSQCNASLGSSIGSSCVFHDITAGDNATSCGDPGAA